MPVAQPEHVQDRDRLEEVVPAIQREAAHLGVDEVLSAGGRGRKALAIHHVPVQRGRNELADTDHVLAAL